MIATRNGGLDRATRRCGAPLRSMLATMAIVIVTACTPSEWHELAVSEGGFSILMRPEPYYAKQQVDTPAGRMLAHLYSSDRRDAYFAVGYSDYPLALVMGTAPDALFAGIRDTWVRRIEGRLVAGDRVTLAKQHPGLEFVAEGKIQGEDAFLHARLFLVDQRLYQIVAIGRKGEVAQGLVNRYLNSFRLIAQNEIGTLSIEPAPK